MGREIFEEIFFADRTRWSAALGEDSERLVITWGRLGQPGVHQGSLWVPYLAL